MSSEMDELVVAKEIYEKILESFPEAEPYLDEDNRDLPYISMSNLADWLESVPDCHDNQEIVRRVKDFDDWVGNHPRGEDAGDDVLTIFVVGFLEKLFESHKLIRLIPYLLDYDDLVANKDYWINWVGATNYYWALSLCESKVTDV